MKTWWSLQQKTKWALCVSGDVVSAGSWGALGFIEVVVSCEADGCVCCDGRAGRSCL